MKKLWKKKNNNKFKTIKHWSKSIDINNIFGENVILDINFYSFSIFLFLFFFVDLILRYKLFFLLQWAKANSMISKCNNQLLAHQIIAPIKIIVYVAWTYVNAVSKKCLSLIFYNCFKNDFINLRFILLPVFSNYLRMYKLFCKIISIVKHQRFC